MNNTTTQTGINWKDLANWLIDYLCERDDALEVIEQLHDYGLTAEQLVEMKFDADDVRDVFDVSPGGKKSPEKENYRLMEENHIKFDLGSLEQLRQAYNEKCEEMGKFGEEICEMDEFDMYFDGLSYLEIQDRLSGSFNGRHDYFKEGDYGIISGDHLAELMNTDILKAVIEDIK